MGKRKKVSKENLKEVKDFFKELKGYNELDMEVTKILNSNNEELGTELPILNYDFEELPKLDYDFEEFSKLNYDCEELPILNYDFEDLLDLNLNDEELEKELQVILNDKEQEKELQKISYNITI